MISVRNSIGLKYGLLYHTLTPRVSRYLYNRYPLVKYKYIRLPMGIMCVPYIFKKNSNLMEDLESSRTYLNDLLYFSKGHFNEHLKDAERVLVRL